MSKSLGNSPDALKLISEYGADSVRVGLMLSSSAGNDLLFDESLCSQGRSFANKIWNAYRLIDGWEIKNFDQPESSVVAVEWYENKFQLVLDQINDHFDKFRISDSLMSVYKLVWDDFCSVLLEIIKPEFSKPIDQKTYDSVISIFENNLKLLHPFMPFISEDLWQSIKNRNNDDENKDEDVLGQFGYSLKCSFENRKKAIKKAIKKYDSLRILRRLVLIRNYSKSYKKNYDKYTKDIEFIKKLIMK